MADVTDPSRPKRSLRQVLSLRGRSSRAAWLRDDLRSARNDPLGPRASVRVRAAARAVRRRPRLLLGLLLDLVIVVGPFVALLAAIGHLGSFDTWSIVCLGPVAGLWRARLRAAHPALEPANAPGDGQARERRGVRREDQITVAELVRAHKH
jgi:hypothetical protein